MAVKRNEKYPIPNPPESWSLDEEPKCVYGSTDDGTQSEHEIDRDTFF